jgi:hypothetical protein
MKTEMGPCDAKAEWPYASPFSSLGTFSCVQVLLVCDIEGMSFHFRCTCIRSWPGYLNSEPWRLAFSLTIGLWLELSGFEMILGICQYVGGLEYSYWLRSDRTAVSPKDSRTHHDCCPHCPLCPWCWYIAMRCEEWRWQRTAGEWVSPSTPCLITSIPHWCLRQAHLAIWYKYHRYPITLHVWYITQSYYMAFLIYHIRYVSTYLPAARLVLGTTSTTAIGAAVELAQASAFRLTSQRSGGHEVHSAQGMRLLWVDNNEYFPYIETLSIHFLTLGLALRTEHSREMLYLPRESSRPITDFEGHWAPTKTRLLNTWLRCAFIFELSPISQFWLRSHISIWSID